MSSFATEGISPVGRQDVCMTASCMHESMHARMHAWMHVDLRSAGLYASVLLLATYFHILFIRSHFGSNMVSTFYFTSAGRKILISLMALFYFDVHGLHTKVIDFGSMPELCVASTQAFLGYSPIGQMAAASKACRSFLYVALSAHRMIEFFDQGLCGACGWVTSRRHVYLACDRRQRTCYSHDRHVCDRCICVHREEVLCLLCLDLSHAGISDTDRVLLHAWRYGTELNDAILENGVYSPRRARLNRPMYPFSVSEVVAYNANEHLEDELSE